MPKPKNHKPKPTRRKKPSRAERHAGRPGGRPVSKPHSSVLPEVGVLVITAIDEHGELIAEPAKWEARQRPPHIVVTDSGRAAPAGVGDRVLAKLRKIEPHLYQALLIKILPSEQPAHVVGIFAATSDGAISSDAPLPSPTSAVRGTSR